MSMNERDVASIRAGYFHGDVKFSGPPRLLELGFEITNLANGQGANADVRVIRRLRLLHGFVTYAMAPTTALAVAGIFQFLGYGYISRGGQPILVGTPSFVGGAWPQGFQGDNNNLPFVRSNAPGLTTTTSMGEAFLSANQKAFVGAGGGGNLQVYGGMPLEIDLYPGDHVGVHLDITSPGATQYAVEAQMTLVYRLLEG